MLESIPPRIPDPTLSDRGNRDVRFVRRNHRLDFLQIGPSETIVRCALTRNEVLVEIRRLCHTRERHPLQSPLYHHQSRTRGYPHRISVPSPLPLRRRTRGASHGRGNGRGTRDTHSRHNPAASMTLLSPNASHGPSIPSYPFQIPRALTSELFSSGSVPSGNRLTLRDLRQIDPSFTARPAIWVREEALVVSLEPIRAIILSDRLFVFNPDHPKVKNALFNIEKRLSHNTDDMFMPFEFRALEGILIHICLVLESDFLAIEPVLRNTLGILPNQISNEQLERLRLYEQQLNHFFARVRKVQSAIQTVLDEDEDMAEMYLTEKRKTPGVTRNALDHDEAEMLLENYLQTVDDLTNRAGLLNQAIDDTENLIEIHLDTMQNSVLLVDLMISAISTTLSFGALMTAIFGMNLPLPVSMGKLPSSHYYFWGFVSFTFLSMGIALLFLVRWCRKEGLYGRSDSSKRLKPSRLGGFGPKFDTAAVQNRLGEVESLSSKSGSGKTDLDEFKNQKGDHGDSFDIQSVP